MTEKLTKVQQQVDETKDLLVSALNNAIQRDQQLHDLEIKSIELINDSNEFKAMSTKVKRQQRYRQIKCWIGILIVFIVIGLFFLFSQINK